MAKMTKKTKKAKYTYKVVNLISYRTLMVTTVRSKAVAFCKAWNKKWEAKNSETAEFESKPAVVHREWIENGFVTGDVLL